MIANKNVYFFVILVVKYVVGDEYKSSLTFVIDDTSSMNDEIDAIINGVNAIFDTVANNNESQIENFILVTFNDVNNKSEMKVRANTKNRQEFSTALSSISVEGGGDCPEFSMAGIKLALEESLPTSYLYVFTDASSKDYEQFEEIKSIALRKQSQVTFVLTGKCSENEDSPAYQVFYNIARATYGELFNLQKKEVGHILEYVKNNIKGRRATLDCRTLPAGSHNYNITIDHKTGDTTVSLASSMTNSPNISITASDGSKAAIHILLETENNKIYSVNVTIPGIHTVEVVSQSEIRVTITARSTVNFIHGFSTFIPSSIKDTSTRPLKDVKSHLSIKLIEGDVEVKTAQILDMHDNILLEVPLQIINEKEKFYITKPIDTPKTMFRIAITVYDPDSKSVICRTTVTLIEPQKIFPGEKVKNVAPSIFIEGEHKRNVEFGKPLHLICNVNAYPKPNIVWKNKDEETILSDEVTIKELPYDYVNILTIESVKNNATYRCEAINPSGSDAKNVIVETKRRYFNVINTPKRIAMKVDEEGKIHCIVDAYPPVQIAWYKNGRQILPDSYIDFSHNKSILTIKYVNPSDKGKYVCKAWNEDKKQSFIKFVTVVGVDRPVIDKNTTKVSVKIGSSAAIECKILSGKPKPNIGWFFKTGPKSTDIKPMVEWDDQEKITINNVDMSHSGTYQCQADNEVNTDSHEVDLIVEYPVTITRPKKTNITVELGSDVTLPCEAKGDPKPEIKWVYQSFNSPNRKNISSKTKNALHFKRIQVKEEGYYTCISSNIFGVANITYNVHVLAPPIIENTYKNKHFVAVEGDRVLKITCKASGNPKPTITWTKNGLKLPSGSTYTQDGGTLVIKNIPKDASGEYKCEAVNSKGVAQKKYRVSIEKYPRIGRVTSSILIEQGKPSNIKCDVPHEKSDQLRWYKHGKLICNGDLVLKNPSVKDSGLYTCRVVSLLTAVTGNVRVTVGYKPRFTTIEDEEIELVQGPPISLNCETSALPKPVVTWYHNGKRLNSTKDQFYFPTGLHSPGKYKCEVTNFFGNISRTFNAIPTDCFISTEKLTKLQPLMVTSLEDWSALEKFENFLFIPKGERLNLFCPKGFQMFPTDYVEAFCDGGMDIVVEGNKYDYSDIQCNEEVTHEILKTGEKCFIGNTEKVKIIYKVLVSKIIEVYEICLDKTNNVPLYAKHTLPSVRANDDYNTTWSDSEKFGIEFDEIYDCEKQIHAISATKKKSLHNRDKCCFSKQQLVNPRDVFPGVEQKSTYSYFNVVPNWGSCNTGNWEEVEQRVRNLPKSSDEVLVWTGTAKELPISKLSKSKRTMLFGDQKSHRQSVHMFLWKVVQHQKLEKSLAIVQVNVPDLSPSEVSKYVLCKDICGSTDWMKNTGWHDVTRGYTYCCNLDEFERAFGFKGVFEPYPAALYTTALE